MKIVRTLFFFTVFWLHQLLILVPLIVFLPLERFTGIHFLRGPVHLITHGWGQLMCFLGGARIRVEDRSDLAPGEAVLIVSNHQGDFDIPMLLAVIRRPLAFVAKKELAHIPLVSAWMRISGCVFLDRDDRRRQVEQIRETVDKLKSGLSMVVFPEGTRSRGPEMGPFAKGSLNIAPRAGVRILPVTLRDTWTLKPKGGIGLPGGRVTVILHPAIDPAALSPEARNNLHETVQAVIASGL